MNKTIFIFIIALNLLLAGAQLWLTTLRATDGVDLAKLEASTAELRLANWRLRDQIYAKSSLQYIQDKATMSNLTAIKPQFSTTTLPVAKASMP